MIRRQFFKTLLTAVSSFAIQSSEIIAGTSKHDNYSKAIPTNVLGLSTITIAAELFCIDPDSLRDDLEVGVFEAKEDNNLLVLFKVKSLENELWSQNLVSVIFTDVKRYKALVKDFTSLGSWIISGMYTIRKWDDGEDYLEMINPVYKNYSQLIESSHI